MHHDFMDHIEHTPTQHIIMIIIDFLYNFHRSDLDESHCHRRKTGENVIIETPIDF